MSEESRRKMSAAALRRPSNRLGVRHTLQTRALISEATRERTPRGRACHSFIDGKLAERRGIRFGEDYKRWRYDVFLRDSFTCRDCGDHRGGNLHAHHIKPFATHPELRMVVDNGLTLCRDCHRKAHAANGAA